MCLACINISVRGKEEIKKVFDFSDLAKIVNTDVETLKKIPGSLTGNILHTFDNKKINLTTGQVQEIIDHALAVVVTGVDTQIDIWAIQWPRDYEVKTLNLYQ